MARAEKINTNFTLSFNSREDNSGDTVADININFDNPKDDSVVMTRLNTWLTAIGYTNLEVKVKG